MLSLAPTVTPHAHALVDLDAIRHNTSLFASRTSAAVMAVVKADGFGHGAFQAATTALAAGATWLGVTTSSEALRLREAGITAPILSWIHSPTECFDAAVHAGIDLSVPSLDHLEAIAAGAASVGVPATVHLKVDTGLHRNGAQPAQWSALTLRARELERSGHVRVRAVWSHLVDGGNPASNETQISLFDEAVRAARNAGLRPEILHLANSVGTLQAPATHYDLVRVGVGLYGLEPDPASPAGLRGAMSLRGRLILVKEVPAGTGVSYGHDYVTTRTANLGLVPLGYADGIPWAAAGRAEVWVSGHRYPVAGRIAMDQFVVDLGASDAAPGDEVVVFGPGTEGEPTAAEWAAWANTLPHEIVTGVGPRVSRRYRQVPATTAEESPHA